jgi:hypothetical protein
MKQMTFRSVLWIMLAAFALVAMGCSMNDSSKLLKDVSGVWKRTKGPGTVTINLTGKTKTLMVDGQSYSATVEKVDMGSYLVNLKVQKGDSQPQKWSIRQVWSESGDSSKLEFTHDGLEEELPEKAGS